MTATTKCAQGDHDDVRSALGFAEVARAIVDTDSLSAAQGAITG